MNRAEELATLMAESYKYAAASDGDGGWYGICAELPRLSYPAPEYRDALDGIKRQARECVYIILRAGGVPPAALLWS